VSISFIIVVVTLVVGGVVIIDILVAPVAIVALPCHDQPVPPCCHHHDQPQSRRRPLSVQVSVVVSCLSAWVALLSHVQLLRWHRDGQDPSVADTTGWQVTVPQPVRGDPGGGGGAAVVVVVVTIVKVVWVVVVKGADDDPAWSSIHNKQPRASRRVGTDGVPGRCSRKA
jgi:hypothetical protein